MSAEGQGLAALKSLYRTVLRLHRDKLPSQMRLLGDSFAGSEFRVHLKNAKTTQAQWQQFAEQWQGYLTTLAPEQHGGSGEAAAQSATAHVAEHLDDYLDDKQKQRLEELRKEVADLGRSMHAQLQPGARAGHVPPDTPTNQ